MRKAIRKLMHYLDRSKDILKIQHKANKCYRGGKDKIASFVIYKIYKKYNCDISYQAEISDDTEFPHPIGIVIGAGVKVGKGVTIYHGVTLGRKEKDENEYPIIKDNVTIYCNATILGGVTIGECAVIGCGAIVLRDIKPGEVVYGIVK